MKLWKSFLIVFSMTLGMLVMNSCNDDDDYSLDKFSVEIMTVVPDGNVYYLRRDNGEKLWPLASNIPGYRHSKTRAQVNYTMLSDSISGFDHGIKVNWIDNILTKNIGEYKGNDNDSIYGTNPVKIEAMGIGDGYLNIRFGANFGNLGIKHLISLIPASADASDPYTLEFRHNAFKDEALYGAMGLVAFDLSSLPDTEGKDVDLNIKVRTFEGEKTYTIKYNSDKKTMLKNPVTIQNSDEAATALY